MAQRRFDDHAPPSGGEPPGELARAAIGMGWLAQLKLRGAAANDNRLPPWPAAAGTVIVMLLAALLIFATLSALR